MKKLLSAFLLISLLAAPLSLSGCGALKKFSATDMTLFDTETVITGTPIKKVLIKKRRRSQKSLQDCIGFTIYTTATTA